MDFAYDGVRAVFGFAEYFGEVDADYAQAEDGQPAKEPDGNDQRRPAPRVVGVEDFFE